MTRKSKIILFSLLVISILIFYSRELLTFIVGNYGLLSVAYGVMVTLISIYYSKNEKFYLFVHKYIFSLFVEYHSKWMFVNTMTNVQRNKSEIKKLILKIFEVEDLKIRKDLDNYFELSIDDEILYKFDIIELNEFLTINYRTNKFTVPTSQYEKRISKFATIFNNLNSVFKPENQSYQVSIYFEGKNPYFGFFIRYLPSSMVKDFNCRFISPKSSNSKVTASKDRITIDSSNTENLRKSTIDYLSLNDTIIT